MADRFYAQLSSGEFPIAVSLARHDMALAQAARDAGADALKLHLNAYHRASGTTFGSFAQEEPFLREVASLGLPLLVMAGQETVPTLEEMDGLAQLGFEGFNLYFAHFQPHLLESKLRPMPAMADTSTKADLDRMNALPCAIIEASIMPFAAYGQPLDDADLAAYRAIVQQSTAPVIAPSQKRFVPDDLTRLRDVGVAGAIVGVVVTGDTPETLYEAVTPMANAARRFR
ncbi:hypothetical protein [Pelagibacterium sp.]|uniref:hypothetical protein n=1 Tax=Pelagibacterium sp. TaxID=1967288 RepID=UPI003BA9F194